MWTNAQRDAARFRPAFQIYTKATPRVEG